MARAAIVRWGAEGVARHREQQCVVVEGAAGGAAQRLLTFAKGREGLGGYVEAQDAAARGVSIARSGRQLADAFSGDQALQVASGLAVRGLEPGGFGFWRGHAGELARGAPAHVAL